MAIKQKQDKGQQKEKKYQKKEKPVTVSRFSRLFIGKEKEYIIEHLAMLLSSGMSITQTLAGIKGEMKTNTMKKIITMMEYDIEDGASLTKALTKTRLFPNHMISLINVGERAGKLKENLEVVVLQQQKDRLFKGKMRSAMMYPVLVLSVSVFVGLGISWFILPKLAIVFDSLNVELPFLTKILIDVGIFLGTYGAVAVPAILITIFLSVYFVFYYKKTNSIGQWILLRVPAIKTLIQQIELGRMGFILGTLLQAGLPIEEALEALSRTTTMQSSGKLYEYLKKNIEEGETFQQSFASYKKANRIISLPIQQMIVAAEQSGSLAETLIRIGTIFEEKIDTTTKNLSVILEPLLLFIVWLGVVGVALAVILPIYSLIGNLN